MEFDEHVFIWAITSRPEDAKRALSIFKPEWLSTPELVPVLRAIYDFIKEHKIVPNLKVLKAALLKQDPELFSSRLKEHFDILETLSPEISEIVFHLDSMRSVAIVRSFQEITADQAIMEAEAKYDGKLVLQKIHKWLKHFETLSEEETLNIKDSISTLIQNHDFDTVQNRVPIGIKPLDEWTNGGLRTQQLGIIVAPSGAGKSSVLMNMAYKTANSQIPTWFITNELTLAEQTERFLSRMTGVEIARIEEDPSLAYKGLDHYWSFGMDKDLWLTSVNKEISTDDLESILQRQVNLYGWKPKVIVLDFMERMRPVETGWRRDKEHLWIGAVAKDLFRLAKRHKLLLWTACQTNRSGLEAEVLNATMLQGSIYQLQEASAVIGMRQVDLGHGDSGQGQIGLEFFDIKARSARRSRHSRVLEVNLETMLITNREVNPEIVVRKEKPQQKEEKTPSPNSNQIKLTSDRSRKSKGTFKGSNG